MLFTKNPVESINTPVLAVNPRSCDGDGGVFHQACRGDKHDDPVTACDAVDSELKTNEVVVDASVLHTLPAGADFIMCYSVAEGEAHRNRYNS